MKKNKTGSRFKLLLTRIFNVRSWADWDRVKAGGQYIRTSAEKYFVPGAVRQEESFEHARKRLKLTEEALDARAHSLYRMSILMALLSLGLFLYFFYHIFYGTFHAALLTFALTLLAGAMGFRYHFWYFQIKSRKLGCSVREWYRQGLLGDKS